MRHGRTAKLALEDGTVVTGRSFGAEGERAGEAVFNTSLMGYQEILTDPSYKGQIVVMTYPLIGNYGINTEDVESAVPCVEGFVVRELSRVRSNFRSTADLDTYLEEHGIPGIEGVDTRMLTRRIRIYGAMRAVLSTVDLDDGSLVEKARSSAQMEGRDLVKVVTPKQPYDWNEPFTSEFAPHLGWKPKRKYRVVVMDYGCKRSILRYLVEAGCSLRGVPATATAEEVLALEPDGVFLSNGPGDPAALDYAIAAIRGLVGRVPIFGICLGHQLLGLALGGRTFKLKFGHRGANQPVMDLQTGKVEITSQNHGFAVDPDSLNPADVELTHVNLNDRTLEGFRHRRYPLFCVQYHPESSPGPHDSTYLFPRFTALMDRAEGRG